MKHKSSLILSSNSLQATTIEDLKITIDNLILMRNEAMNYGDSLYSNKQEIWEVDMGIFKTMDIWGRDELDNDYKNKLQIILDGNNDFPFNTSNLDEANIVLQDSYNGLYGFNIIPIIVHNKDSWYVFHRQYFYTSPPPKNDFCDSLSPFFPNLYLNPVKVPQSLNSFTNPPYREVMQTIIYHLTAINDSFYDFFINKNFAGDKACDEVENLYSAEKIKIRSSRDTNKSDDLEIKFTDISKGLTRKIYCDLHTKFCDYFEVANPSPEQRANRIYFDFPKDDFLDKKVLVGWIGFHRD